MAINFPDSPTTGQSFTVGDVTWVYDGAKWAGAGAVSAVENIYGGAAGNVLYQSGANDTAFTAAGTSGQVLLSGGTGSPTWSNTIVGATLTSPEETWTTSATAATGTVNFDCATQGVLHYTTNASADWTLNFRGNSSTSLNTLLANGQAITVNFLVAQGATAYRPTGFQVDGSAVTPKWSGGTAPSAGNASATDAYSFTISKTGSATYNVFAAGPIKYS